MLLRGSPSLPRARGLGMRVVVVALACLGLSCVAQRQLGKRWAEDGVVPGYSEFKADVECAVSRGYLGWHYKLMLNEECLRDSWEALATLSQNQHCAVDEDCSLLGLWPPAGPSCTVVSRHWLDASKEEYRALDRRLEHSCGIVDSTSFLGCKATCVKGRCAVDPPQYFPFPAGVSCSAAQRG